MKLVKVIGSITSTIKDETLKGFKILVVQSVDVNLEDRNDYYVVVDTVGMGEGELGLMVTCSTAKGTESTKSKNVDAALVARVDRIDLK